MSAHLKSLQDVERSLAEMQRLEIDLDAQTIEMEARKAAIAETYAARLAEMEEDLKVLHHSIMAYLKANKAQFEGPPRSVQFVSGTVGFRLGQKHLKPITKWTWEKVLQNLMDNDVTQYIRSVPEVNREAMLSAADAIGATGLKKYGLKVAQDDKPFIEVQRDEAPLKETT